MDQNRTHEAFLQRCCDLANLTDAGVSPNPRVGAVLVHGGRIIGEGLHARSGQAHAEVNCLAAVRPADRHLIPQSTLYVSLEPCCFYGRTPACTDLIQRNNIQRVVIGQRDMTAEVNGKGIDILRTAGVEVLEFPDFTPARRLVAPRQLFAAAGRPYVMLKYARSADGFLAPRGAANYWITAPPARRLVHFWRSRTNAIAVGAGTVIADDPRLDTRLYPGPSPLPIVFDPRNRIESTDLRLWRRTDGRRPLVFQTEPATSLVKIAEVVQLPKVDRDSFDWRSSKASVASRRWLDLLHETLLDHDCNHLTVEGGAGLLGLYLAAGIWDEARVFTSRTVRFGAGLPAPSPNGEAETTISIGPDELSRYFNPLGRTAAHP